MDIRDLIRVVTSRWWLVIPLFLIVFGTVVVLTLNQTAMYRSSTTYLVQPSLSESADLLGALGIVSRQSEIASTYAEIAASRRINRAASEASGLSDEQLDGVSLQAQLVPGTNVLAITTLASDPEVARDFAGAVGEATATYTSELYGDIFELQLLDSPQVSRKPASPNVMLYLVLGLAVALVLSIGAAFALEILGGSRVISGKDSETDPSGAATEGLVASRLAEQMAHARWTGRPFSLGLIDLDGCHLFRGLTHAAQSDALARIAAIIGEYVTAGDLVGRVGPQVFAVLLPERDSTDALTLVQYLGQRARIATLDMGPAKQPVRLDPAIAVVTYVNAGLTVESLLLVANEALGRARAEHDRHCDGRPAVTDLPPPRAANAPLWTYPTVTQAAATREQPRT